MLDISKIKVIGFDLDQTLYPKSPEIDEAIQVYLYQKIAEKHHVTFDEAEKMFKDLYKDGKGLSGSKTMSALGFDNGSDLVQEALENADIEKFLVPNPLTIDLLRKLKKKYTHLDIVTGSNKDIADKKIAKLQLNGGIFEHIITQDDGSKSSLQAYNVWLEKYSGLTDIQPSNFLYIGDRVSSDHDLPKSLGIETILVNQKKIDPSLKCLQLASLHDLSDHLL